MSACRNGISLFVIISVSILLAMTGHSAGLFPDQGNYTACTCKENGIWQNITMDIMAMEFNTQQPLSIAFLDAPSYGDIVPMENNTTIIYMPHKNVSCNSQDVLDYNIFDGKKERTSQVVIDLKCEKCYFEQGIINSVDIITENGTYAGIAIIELQGDYLLIEFNVDYPWMIDETSVGVGKTPSIFSNPKNFPNVHKNLPAGTYSDVYYIPISDLKLSCGNRLYFAIYSELNGEAAWAWKGDPDNWGDGDARNFWETISCNCDCICNCPICI